MWGERNCLSFETAVGEIEPPSSIDSPALYRATTAPHINDISRQVLVHRRENVNANKAVILTNSFDYSLPMLAC